MRRRPPTIAPEDAAVRFAWWAAFFATLTLAAILGLAKSAQALTVPPTGPAGTLIAPAPASNEEFEDGAEAREDEGFEFEECEEDEGCEEETDLDAPQECLLSNAEATVFATANKDKVRLQVRYTTTSPTAVTVDYGLHGAKGSLYLGGERKQFDREGVLRLNKSLSESQMAKVMAAKGFTVRLRVAAAPGYCRAFFDHQLNVRRATPSGLAWQQAE